MGVVSTRQNRLLTLGRYPLELQSPDPTGVCLTYPLRPSFVTASWAGRRAC